MTQRYREAGVDLSSARTAKERILAALATARSDYAYGALGAFGGMVRVPPVDDPLLVMSTDGVGTKVLVAIMAQRHDTVGQDLVNHCVNDILVHGARPLAFLDYIAAAAIDPEVIAAIVDGVARACSAHDMTLTGGETAEMPDLYRPGHYDLAGTIVGVVPEAEALGTERVQAGDVLVGIASNGLHTNGYSLARRIVFDQLGLDVDSHVESLGGTVGDELLRVHRSYASLLLPRVGELHAMAHITGGGIPGNLSRALPIGLGARVKTSAWEPPPVFRFLQDAGSVAREEMFDVFNMGVGMIAVTTESGGSRLVDEARRDGVDAWMIGEIVAGQGVELH